MNIVEFKNVSKAYGRQQVLENISFTLQPGRITTLLGPNGSGKTTLLRIAAGVLGWDSGSVSTCGIAPAKAKGSVAYLMDSAYLPWSMKRKNARQYFLDYFADFDAKAFDELADFMEVPHDKNIVQMSKGMVEKFHLALILARKSKAVLLDEPLGGVDLIARDNILKAIVRRFSEDSAILVSTHLVGDIERYVDDAIILKNGSITQRLDVEQTKMDTGMSLPEMYRAAMANTGEVEHNA